MEISWTDDNKLKIIADVDTFKKIQDDAYYQNDYNVQDALDQFVKDDFAPTQVDLEQSTHPGVSKEYDAKLNGYDLELLGKLSGRTGSGELNAAFCNLLSKIRKQVPYQF